MLELHLMVYIFDAEIERSGLLVENSGYLL